MLLLCCACLNDIGETKSCSLVHWAGGVVRRTYGAERRFDNETVPKRCGGCGVEYESVHHPGCEVEECPTCNVQAIGCACRHEIPTWRVGRPKSGEREGKGEYRVSNPSRRGHYLDVLDMPSPFGWEKIGGRHGLHLNRVTSIFAVVLEGEQDDGRRWRVLWIWREHGRAFDLAPLVRAAQDFFPHGSHVRVHLERAPAGSAPRIEVQMCLDRGGDAACVLELDDVRNALEMSGCLS